MDVTIIQKYMSLHSKYRVEDEDGKMLCFAENEIFRLRGNMTLYTASGNALYVVEAQFMHFFSFFLLYDASHNEIGCFKEKLHMPNFRRALIKMGDVEMKFKCGPIHMKTFVKKDGKWDKKHPVVTAKKRIMHVADKYVAHIDEKRIKPAFGILVGIYYDMIRHGNKH